ncbi:hypothetical protein K7432_018324 [Basidiobolus ranarum]|uniref:Chitin-binding type-2 domain-containing protein n=1 Tax=Basidiobolus ranarum TaxID=34480 RepID=A0ABR2VK90_9FUNG
MKTVRVDCMTSSLEYDVPVPNTVPNGKAILGWTWINKTGNREYYMNCADITIEGGTGHCISGPKNFVANLPGFPTIPEFTSSEDSYDDYFQKRPYITSCAASEDTNLPQSEPDHTDPIEDKSTNTNETDYDTVDNSEADKQEDTSKQIEGNPASECKIQCIDGPIYQVCGHGGMTPFRMSCAAGTTCHIKSGQVFCL